MTTRSFEAFCGDELLASRCSVTVLRGVLRGAKIFQLDTNCSKCDHELVRNLTTDLRCSKLFVHLRIRPGELPPVRSGCERLLSVAAVQAVVSAEQAIGFAQDPLQQSQQAPESTGRA